MSMYVKCSYDLYIYEMSYQLYRAWRIHSFPKTLVGKINVQSYIALSWYVLRIASCIPIGQEADEVIRIW